MIKRFIGEYRWLSNFHPVEVFLDGVKYPSVENAYVAAKTLDPTLREPLQTMTSGQAKSYGKTLVLRSDWDAVRVRTMQKLLRQKFVESELAEKLIATGDEEIVEGNTWHDNFWGSCICESCGDKGRNMLGFLLMQIREEVKYAPRLTF